MLLNPQKMSHEYPSGLRSVDLIMAADVQKDDLFVGDHDGKSDAIAVGDAHRLDILQLPIRR